MSNTSKKSGGGSATAGGMDFQHRVAAWATVHILAEKGAAPPWSLPSDTTLEFIRCETEHPVDDLLFGTSAGGFVFAQVKRSLTLLNSPDSDLASALDQFVRQFIALREEGLDELPNNRPLSSTLDRLVLITSSKSSEPIRILLPRILQRCRELGSDQPLGKAATNKREHDVLSVLLTHLRRSWKRVIGLDSSDDELKLLLSLLHVHVLSVDENGDGEREAKTILRTAVLKEPDHADVSWARLVGLCAELAAKRSGADRPTLQNVLLTSSLPLAVPRGYSEDIEKLKRYTAMTSDTLAHLSRIRVGETTIKIQRDSTKAIRQAVEKDSLLVVGEPGAGKSGALHDLVEAIKSTEQDCVFLAVDRLSSQSITELTGEMSLDHEFLEVLDNWPGLRPGILVIDALDAARGNPAGQMLRDLIRQVVERQGRWRIVASIRKFDLRYAVETRTLFSGSPETEFQDGEFSGIRHVNVPRLSDHELNQVRSQSDDLNSLIDNAAPGLSELLRVPFNLRLLAELLGGGATVNELNPIKTQLDLLDRYWSYRVVREDGHGDDREAVLRNTCENMIEARTLRVGRAEVANDQSGTHLNDLLSHEILIEWQDRYVIAFAHHVLFDYAVARLLLRGTPENFIRRLIRDPELALVVRPSLVFHFRYLWLVDNNHELFWKVVLEIMNVNEIPEIGKLIGPSVVAESANQFSDLEILCLALEEPATGNETATDETAAEGVLKHIVGALTAETTEQVPLVGPDAGPWCKLLERVSKTLRPFVAYSVRALLSTISENPEQLTPDQLVDAGHSARRLLEFAWSQVRRDGLLVTLALQSVCRTFESNPTDSTNLIKRCLEPGHISKHGFEEMFWLAREVKRLIHLDPSLCEQIYCAVFGHEEESNEETPFGSSRILPMTSNRRQDYGMACYQLGEVFSEFLRSAPENAIRALISVMNNYVVQHHSASHHDEQTKKFDFDGLDARICTDSSGSWDQADIYSHDDPVKMLDAFERYLEELSSQQGSIDNIRAYVRLLVLENLTSVLWRRVLQIASKHPNTLGRVILPVASAIPILTGYDTSHTAGEFLKAIAPSLEAASRERIERAILSIPNTVADELRNSAESVRNRLLGCLSGTEFVVPEARQLFGQLKANANLPANTPPIRHGPVWSKAYGEEDYLREQGVPVEAEANRRIRELEAPVKEFASRHLNSPPTQEENSNLLPSLKALHAELTKKDHHIHPKQSSYAWGPLAEACACIATTDGLTPNDPAAAFAKLVLLEASHNSVPTPDPEFDAQFDNSPAWGTPAPRIESAQGLIALARNESFATDEVLEAIERLSGDAVPSVRYQIATSLNALFYTANERMWSIIERMCREDSSRGVLQGLLSGPLNHISSVEPDRVTALTLSVLGRVNEGPGTEKVREMCTGILSGLYIWRGHVQSLDIVFAIVSEIPTKPSEGFHLIANIREAMTHGPTDSPNPDADAIRDRTFRLVKRILQSARESMQQIQHNHQEIYFAQWPETEREKWKSLGLLMDRISLELYFASGAYNERHPPDFPKSPAPQSKRFYEEASDILDELAEVKHASIVHHLLQTLEFFIPLDPKGVFLRIGKVVHAGREGGYQYESLGADLLVRIVERYLAEYRALLQQDDSCRQTLIHILDVFVQAGWPSARRLTYRLEEIFR